MTQTRAHPDSGHVSRFWPTNTIQWRHGRAEGQQKGGKAGVGGASVW